MATDAKIINPTNSPPVPGAPLPFIRSASGKAETTAIEHKDTFNNGKDYPDEGAPLLLSDGNRPRYPVAAAMMQGIINAPTRAEIEALTKIDETSQTQTRFLERAVVMDVDAKLVVSTMDQMKRGVFREASYPTMADYFKSPYYRKLRETRIVAEQLAGIAQQTKLRESTTVAGVRLNPRLVKVFNKVDSSILKGLKASGFVKEAKRLRESLGIKKLREQDEGMTFSETPTWDGGMIADQAGRQPDFAPLIAGPFNKQLYWFDYLDMHAKAFEAATHNPVAKRIIKVITQFVLGKGVKLTVMRAVRDSDAQQVKQDTAGLANKMAQQGMQQAQGQRINSKPTMTTVPDYKAKCQHLLNTHWTKNSLHIRSKQILKDLITFGEQFIRYFDAPWGLKIRQIDPSTVWEVITDPDDCENEFYLHQQYPTRYQWYVDLPVPTIKFIIRQVPSLHYYHMKINSTAGEVRGRSELFAILGWLKRLKEWASDRVVRNKMANLFVLDVSVEGDASSVALVQQQFATPPTPGSFFIHNKAAELKAIASELGASDAQNDWQVFLTLAGMGAGVSLQYLGAESQGGKAQALVGTEPDIKSFEDYQEFMEQFFLQDAQRVFERAKERGEIPRDVRITVEATFPTLAEENRSEKLKDLAFGESMSWWSHRRVAAAAAKEMQMTSYDYDDEQKQIAQEDAMKEFLINTAYQQVTKGVDNSRMALGMSGGRGGTSSGSSGRGASGMGMGRLPGASGSGSSGAGGAGGGSKQSGESETTLIDGRRALHETEDDTEDDAEGVPATAPGTSTATGISSLATPHNASSGDRRLPWEGADVDGSTGRKDHYRGRDPRDVSASIKREAANLRYERRAVGRREDRVETPNKIRDQKSLDRDIIGKAKQALKSGNLNKEAIRRFPRLAEGGPGSGPRKTHYTTDEGKKATVTEDPSKYKVQIHIDGKQVFDGSRWNAKAILLDNDIRHEFASSGEKKKLDPEKHEKGKEEYRKERRELQKQYGRKSKMDTILGEESMEPFKPQDGDRLQNPRVQPVEEHFGSPRNTGKMRPKGYANNKRED